MHCFNLRSHPYCRLAGYLEFERGLVVECNRHMAFVAGLGLDRTAFEEVSQFAVECHKIILLYRSPVDSPSGLLLLRTCIGPVWFCHSSATLASNTFRSWYSPKLGWL